MGRKCREQKKTKKMIDQKVVKTGNRADRGVVHLQGGLAITPGPLKGCARAVRAAWGRVGGSDSTVGGYCRGGGADTHRRPHKLSC